MPTERKHREEIVRYGRMLHERGFVAAMDGNLSVRLPGDRILVTPTCLSKGAMRPADMVIVDLDGKRIAGRRNVTSEVGMHLLIYRMRADVQAIVPRASTHGHRLRRRRNPVNRAPGLRGRHGPGMHSPRSLRHARHIGIGADSRAVCPKL